MAPWDALPWPHKAVVSAVLGAVLLASVTIFTCAVALAGLGQFNAEIEITRVPAWFWHFRADPQVQGWVQRGLIGALVLHGAAGVALLRPKPKPLHGDARLANEGEIRRAGLRARDGVILGTKGGSLLRSDGPEHIFVCAPTGSGKSSGISIPTLLSYEGPAVVLDIKGECWERTAGWRASRGRTPWLFEPFNEDGRTARFNPLAQIDREDPERAYDALQRIATILFPNGEGAEGFWNLAARDAFLGVAMLVTESPDAPLTLGEINRWFAEPNFAESLQRRIEDRTVRGEPLSAICVSSLNNFIGNSTNTVSSIKVSVTARLQAWSNARVDAATSVSDFDIASLRSAGSTLYLRVAPGDLARAAPIFSLFIELLLDHLGRGPAARPGENRLLVVLDEFASLGRLSTLGRSFAWIGGYGVRLICVVQNRGQLHQIYGAGAEEIIGNCGLQVFFGPNALSDARQLSDTLGQHGQTATSTSGPIGLGSGRRSKSRSEQRRNLMLPQELMRLDRHRIFIVARGFPPIAGQWFQAWRYREFKRRTLEPPYLAPRARMTRKPAQRGKPAATKPGDLARSRVRASRDRSRDDA